MPTGFCNDDLEKRDGNPWETCGKIIHVPHENCHTLWESKKIVPEHHHV
jgi:hypothetical protein